MLVNTLLYGPELYLLDINECLTEAPCQHYCSNLIGSFECSCHLGYALQLDGSSCEGRSVSLRKKNVYYAFSVSFSVSLERLSKGKQGFSYVLSNFNF